MSELPTADDLIGLGRELSARITGERGRYEVLAKRAVNLAHVPYVHGLTIHTLRLGNAVFVLHEQGLRLEAMPLIRSCYEHALTAVWLSEGRETVRGAFNEDLRQRVNLAEAMRQSASFIFQEKADQVAHINDEPVDAMADIGAQARSFQRRCEALSPGGKDAYVIYRALCSFTHPTASIVDQYLHDNEQGDTGVTLLMEPKPFTAHAFLFMTVASMTWASRALDNMDRDRTHRAYLRNVARELQIHESLRLSQQAVAAEKRADRDRRHAAWKGRKPRRRRGDPETDGTP